MVTVSLRGAEFFAFHGFYPEEQKLGNKFIVDVDVSFYPFDNLREDKIAHTVDYERVYHIVGKQMKRTSKLLETVARTIADEIKTEFPFAEKIRISLKKMNPPLGGKVDYSNIVIEI
ncbi:MAG TPA: dihydroneopterin aldolase [Mucilaginibacter sp.]|nr:dihydroneopterin aldolase [Mucilaginibacter sp.]